MDATDILALFVTAGAFVALVGPAKTLFMAGMKNWNRIGKVT